MEVGTVTEQQVVPIRFPVTGGVIDELMYLAVVLLTTLA
jgi:hypothetical protein